jgi:HlyD family secretion protein
VIFEGWGGPPLDGRVRVVAPAGFLKVSALGVEEQRVNVIADFVSPLEQRRSLGDAYRIDARIVVWQGEGVMQAPVGALFRSGGRWATFVVDHGRARLKFVEVGHSDGHAMEIVGGLKDGDTVLVHANDKVADGVRIRIRANPPVSR